MKILSDKEYNPIFSPYLSHGYQQDIIHTDHVEIDLVQKTILLRLNVDKFFYIEENKFHLSSTQAHIWSIQAGIAYACYENNLLKRPGETMVKEHFTRYQKPIDKRQFNLQAHCTFNRKKDNKYDYSVNFSFDNDAFTGHYHFVLFDRAIKPEN